jgi:hypothetical protein
VLFGVQQAAAFTLNDFDCIKQGGVSGTCFYDPNACASPSTPTTPSPTTSSPNIPAGGKDVGATEFTDAQGYHSDSLNGTFSYAELSPPGTAAVDVKQETAVNLGGLAYKQKLAITYQGKTVVAEKLDIGQGGPDIDGKSRDIDLHFNKTAQALGITDPNNWSGVVHVAMVVDATPLGPVSDSSTLVNTNNPAVTPPSPSPSGSCCSTASSATLTGKDNEEKTWNFLKASGDLSDAQIAGVMGNLQQESSFNPELNENGSGNTQTQPLTGGADGWGLAQWTYPFQVVTDLVRTYNISGPIYELPTQLQLILAQMKNTSPNGRTHMIQGLKQINDASQAASYFDANFEGGTDPSNIRENNAVAILAKYGGTSGNPGNPGTGSCAGSSGSPDCTTATGNAKILCEAKKYDPVDYVWGGGHAGGAAYHQACSTIAANNSACGLDCSGLVSVAVYDAFKNSASWDTTTIVSDHTNWREINFSGLQPGDVIEPDSGHVEIIDHVDGDTIYTFGAHTPNVPQTEQVGPTHYTKTSGYRYFHYVGQGSS